MRDRVILAILAPTTLALYAAVVVFAVWAGQFSASPTVVNATDILWHGDLYRRVSESSAPTESAAKLTALNPSDFWKISRPVNFRPGNTFLVSPTLDFADLREYQIGKDGSIWDNQGLVLPAEAAWFPKDFTDVLGPDGTPWFQVSIWPAQPEPVFITYKPNPDHTTWVKK